MKGLVLWRREASLEVRVAVVDVVVVVVSACDRWSLPHHCDGVGSGARFNHLQVVTSRGWSYVGGGREEKGGEGERGRREGERGRRRRGREREGGGREREEGEGERRRGRENREEWGKGVEGGVGRRDKGRKEGGEKWGERGKGERDGIREGVILMAIVMMYSTYWCRTQRHLPAGVCSNLGYTHTQCC